LKPAASGAVNGKPALNDRATPPGRKCSSLGPSGRRVQPASNTQFEFDLSLTSHLDKMAISQHAGDTLKTIRFGFDRLNWGWI
jgi:hypothetical protein